jgi:molybdopterin-guanine dinucleotide biosynthesis protein A
MGTDKATIVWRGETLARRAGHVLSEVCEPVVEVGPGHSGMRSVREEPPGGGPLRALLAGVDALQTSGPVMLLACDMPMVDAPLLRLIAEWPGSGTVIPVTRSRAQYGCARYGARWLGAARLTATTSFKSIVDDACEYVHEAVWYAVAPLRALDDVDTPEELARTIDTYD